MADCMSAAIIEEKMQITAKHRAVHPDPSTGSGLKAVESVLRPLEGSKGFFELLTRSTVTVH
jgi:hypothetical protein